MAKTKITLTAGTNPTEGGNNGSYLISLSKPAPTGGLIVRFNMTGSAKFNTDYTFDAGTNISAVSNHSFTIAAGATSATLNVIALTDNSKDPNETATLNLNAGKGYTPLFDSTRFTKIDYSAGSYSMSVISGDFNNDGKLDLAVANYYDNTVSVLLRNATNTDFDAKVDVATGSYSSSVISGDFNNDGKLDLAVINNSMVSVLLRNSANTGFDTKVDYSVGLHPNSVTSGDFNNDGKLDLAVANYYDNTVSVLLRNATNTGFDTKIDYHISPHPYLVSSGDFNNDGKFDLVVAKDNSNTISVLLRNATNTGFDTKVDVATGLYPCSIVSGDFNNDGKLDLAVANYYDNTVSVLLRNATNTGFDTKIDYHTSSHPCSVSSGDFNNDGKLDLAVANYYDNTVSVLLRNATNTDFDAKVDVATGSGPISVTSGDFNNDGKLDLAVLNATDDSVSVLTNTYGSATLTINNANILPTGSVIITGTVMQKHILTASNTLADADGLGAIKYQWLANGIAINNATKNTYKLTQNEVDKTITVTASYTDKHGNAEAVTSNATTKVINVNDLPTGTVTISDNTPKTGQLLTVSNTLADADGLGTIHYSWLVNRQIVATGSEYIVSHNDAHKIIKVVASYVDHFATTETVSSVNTDKITVAKPIHGTTSSDTLNGNYGNDSIEGYGGNDLLNGNNGNDLLDGGNGNDLLNGGKGNDLLIGGEGRDVLKGYTGQNTLDGGAGNDILNGGVGNNTFILNSPSNGIDRITYFSVNNDTIQLAHNFFTALQTTGVLNGDNFVIAASALDNNDYIIYNNTTGALFYDTDGNGANTQIQIATLGLNLALTNTDFVVS